MEKKIMNDATAYIEGLAQMRHRNKEWARKAVLEGDSLPAEEALKIGVIDFMAHNLSDLLNQLNGHSVTIAGNKM